MIATSAAHAVLLAPLGVYLLWWRQRINESANQRTISAMYERRSFARSSSCCACHPPRLCHPAGSGAAAAGAVQLGPVRHAVQHGVSFRCGRGVHRKLAAGLMGPAVQPIPRPVLVHAAGDRQRDRLAGLSSAATAPRAGCSGVAVGAACGLFGKWWMWWGGFAWGPRFLVPLAPILVLVLLPWLDGGLRRTAAARSRTGRCWLRVSVPGAGVGGQRQLRQLRDRAARSLPHRLG